jgi:hypothetical protein
MNDDIYGSSTTSDNASGDMANDQVDPRYPIAGYQGRILFFLLVLAVLFVMLSSCSNIFFIPGLLPEELIIILLIILAGFIVALSMSSDFLDFFITYLFIIIFFSPLIVYIAFFPLISLYILSFFIITICALYSAVLKYKKNLFDKFMESLYVLWVMAGVFITGYQLGYLPQHTKITQALELKVLEKVTFYIHSVSIKLLDFRIILSIVFGLFLAATALIYACRAPLPTIPSIQSFALDKLPHNSNVILKLLIDPLLFITNIILNILTLITNASLKMLVTIGYYIYHFTYNFTNRLYSYFINKKIWGGILKVIISYSIAVASTYGILLMAPLILDYLRSNLDPTDYIKLQHFSLLIMVGTTMAILLTLSIYRPLWFAFKGWEISLNRIGMSGAIIVLAFAVSSLIMYLIKLSKLIPMEGFQQMGLFLICFLILIACFATYIVIKRIFYSAPQSR